MVRIVWPGEIQGVRKATVGNWSSQASSPASQGIIVGDGGLDFFDYPDGQRQFEMREKGFYVTGGCSFIAITRNGRRGKRRASVDAMLRRIDRQLPFSLHSSNGAAMRCRIAPAGREAGGTSGSVMHGGFGECEVAREAGAPTRSTRSTSIAAGLRLYLPNPQRVPGCCSKNRSTQYPGEFPQRVR